VAEAQILERPGTAIGQRKHMLDRRGFAPVEWLPEAHWISTAPTIFAVTMTNLFAALFALKVPTKKPR